MRIPIEDIKTFATEVHFAEEAQELNRILSQDGAAEYRLVTPLQVSVTHMRSGEDLLFSGTIHGELTGQCARCLEEYPFALAREFSLVLTPQRALGREMGLSPEELSASFYSGETIDVSALVQEQTLLALPSQPLCDEACKGLCPQCGANLNLMPCECRPAWKDPRLAILSTLRVPSPRVGQ
ncbi:MAG: DUF177 domain-containing protein [Deltaproteobacteria bacterium]|nr:DUF177 domain-containing protein [Deltaproteobacteria bacterium]